MSLKYLIYWNLFNTELNQKNVNHHLLPLLSGETSSIATMLRAVYEGSMSTNPLFQPPKICLFETFHSSKVHLPMQPVWRRMINKNGKILRSIGFWVCLGYQNQRTYSSKLCLLTSTWSHKSCLLQIFAISSIGSNAPFTVVPAVALTKNGVFPSALCLKIRSSSLSGRILPLKKFVKYTWS